jgi:ribosome-binding factor A
MPNLRLEKVRELLKRALGEAIRREFNVSDVGLISVNDVDCAGDLKTATVYRQHPGQRGPAEARP